MIDHLGAELSRILFLYAKPKVHTLAKNSNILNLRDNSFLMYSFEERLAIAAERRSARGSSEEYRLGFKYP